MRRNQAEQLKNVRAYLLTKDLRYLEDCARSERTVPDAKRLAGYLDDPTIRRALPPELSRLSH